jgi:FKBP-type peptidyl-prolyl cis-trans isomerase
LYKKKMAEEAKALRESAKEARAKERQKAAEEAAARRAQKEQEKRVRDSQKALQQSQRGKRAASKPPKGRQAKRRSNNSVRVGAIKAQPAPSAPPKTTRTRSTTAPKKYSE